MTTQTAVLQQINIIRVCDANADWSQAVGYEKGENIVAHEGVAQTIAKVIAKLAAQHGPVVLSDQIRPELGRAVARIDRMWCGGGCEYVYAAAPAPSPSAELVSERAKLANELANCESGAFPGSQEHREESYAIMALSRFDARHPEVLKSLRGWCGNK